MSFVANPLKSLSQHRVLPAVFLLAVLSMVILPLPPAVLDVLFTFNVVLSIIVVLVAVTVRRPLEFSAFPTIILGATLLRLTLNVASTRVVLLNGHQGSAAAGHVIESFGKVVIGGNFIVGFVVFVILMIINFMVVTKGSERISEVSARFTLDALPGKQMAIDADLNAGLINQEQAQIRRREVASEADFYGAMDGASKFVRGDAIAGILVLVVNVVGGVGIGALMHGLSFGDAFRQYALLTIGDGLVAQIPSLLLAAAAGIVVTRVNDSDHFEQQVRTQLLASPSVLYSAAAVMFLLAVIPGMPFVVFATFAAVLAFAAWRIAQRGGEASDDPRHYKEIETALRHAALDNFGWDNLPVVESVTVRFGFRLVDMIDSEKGAVALKRFEGMRRGLSESMGFVIPSITAREDLRLSASEYTIALFGVEVARAEVYNDKLMAIPSPNVYGELDGRPDVDPAYQMRVTWIPPENKAHALALGYRVVDAPSVVTTHLDKILRDHLHELFSHDDVASLMRRVEALAPKLHEALNAAMTHDQIRRVCRVLLADNVSLKNIVPIATTLLEYASMLTDPVLLASEVRCTLRREIVHSMVGTQSPILAARLSGELEGMLLASFNQAQQSGKMAMDNFPIAPNLLTQLQTGLPGIAERLRELAPTPILLVAPQLRPLLARHARLFAPALRVLSFNEIPDRRNVEVIGSLG